MQRASRQFSALLYLTLFVAAVYGGLFIYRTSFTVGTERYFVLFDDAMVAMRYARNLATGNGLVWNPGEAPVEGFTNPLWTLYMAACHLLPLPASKASLLIQLSGIFILAVNVLFVARIASLISCSSLAWLASVLLTGFYYPLINWTLLGMEVGFLTLVTSISVYLAVSTLQDNRFRPLLYWWLAIGLAVRMDFVIIAAAIAGCLFFFDGDHRRRHLIHGAIFLGGSLALQTGLRLWYYGDLFPNTYYLKMTGYPLLARVKEGALALLRFFGDSSPAILAAPVWLLISRRRPAVQLLFTVFAVEAGYSVYVGGDAWEAWGGSNRYLTLVMPLLFVLVGVGTFAYFEHLADQQSKNEKGEARARSLTRAGFIVFLLLINIVSGAETRPLQVVAGAAILSAVFLVPFILRLSRVREEGALRGYLKQGAVAILILTFLSLHATNPHPVRTWLLLDRPIGTEDNREMVLRALVIRSITLPDAVIGVVLAGTGPYFADRPAVDFLGKNDRVIARKQCEALPDTNPFRPGHMKWNYHYSIARLQPDVIVQLWPIPGGLSLEAVPPQAQDAMRKDYVGVRIGGVRLYLRGSSGRILWGKIGSLVS